MKTQTKCTLWLCCLFIVEIFPLPFTALIGIYVVRKRPQWFPKIVNNLYADKTGNPETLAAAAEVLSNPTDLKTRQRCTTTLIIMTLFDLVLPVTIPVGIYVVRKRPDWFQQVVNRLYLDTIDADDTLRKSSATSRAKLPEREKIFLKEELAKKLQEIEQENLDFAHAFAVRNLVKK
ncbi:MAG: hypothetical protein ACU837_00165 [Gammaproteobacteria bacterium]